MARLKNSAYAGAAPNEVDRHVPSWARVVRNALADLALTYDKLTGSNAEANTIKHDGTAGRGALLGFPWINQTFGGRDARLGQWGVDLTYTSATSGAKGDASAGQDTVMFGVPVYVPAGEQDMTVRITGRGLDVWPWRVQLVEESTATVLFSADLAHNVGPRYESLELTTHDNGTDGSGKLCLLLIYADTTQRQTATGTSPDGQIRAYSLFAGPTRIRSQGVGGRGGFAGAMPIRRSTSDFTVTAAGASALAWYDFDTAMLADLMPCHSILLSEGNRNANGLAEFATGWPAGGNASYTQADSADVNPATSRFFSHAHAGFALDPQIDLPLWAQAFGAFMLDGHLVVDAATPPTKGLMDWYAEIPIATAVTAHWTGQIQMPDFRAGVNSRIRGVVLAGSDNGAEAVKWKSSWKLGSSAASTAVAFGNVGGTVGNKLYTSKSSGMDFDEDSVANTSDLRLEKTAAKSTVDELVIMGACLYFERD